MAGVVKLESIRNISRLTFPIPDRGVWLLTAGNGAGKSSLLACLRRIGDKFAFPTHFPGSQRSKKLDNFEGAKVSYELHDHAVTYAYSGVRWVPTPKKGGDVLDAFGYKKVVYIGASADRITPRPEDFDVWRAAKAKRYIIDNANDIFSTSRFNELRTVNVTRGVGNQAFVMGHDDNPKTYHSEKQFSMGELCILNLLRQLESCPNNSLLLIDELELALHPAAQVKLLRFLEKEAKSKSLTVVFSTHSVTLLKSVSRSRILFLNNDGSGNIEVLQGCFPTYALGSIALEEEKSPDTIIYVEDEMAHAIVEPILKLCISAKYRGSDLAPTVRVMPIGAFHAVVKFLRMGIASLPPHITQIAALDEDVKSESLSSWTKSGESARLAEFNRIKDHIRYLPWTPEVALCTAILDDRAFFESHIRDEYMDKQYRLDMAPFADLDQLQGKLKRDRAKVIVKGLIAGLSAAFGSDTQRSRKVLCDSFAQKFVSGNKSTAMATFGPLV